MSKGALLFTAAAMFVLTFFMTEKAAMFYCAATAVFNIGVASIINAIEKIGK